jgi:hypothetical protein
MMHGNMLTIRGSSQEPKADLTPFDLTPFDPFLTNYYFECLDDTSTMHEDLKIGLLKEIQKIEKIWGLI